MITFNFSPYHRICGTPFLPSLVSTLFQLLFFSKVMQVLQIHRKENEMFSVHIKFEGDRL